jgi:hypothetical protein
MRQPEQIPNAASLPDEMCDQCRKISFEGFLSNPGDKPAPRRKISLRHIGPQRECRLCRFFYQTRDHQRLEKDPQNYELHRFGAKRVLGAREADIDDSPALYVAAVGSSGISNGDGPGIIMAVSGAHNGLFARRIAPKVDPSLLTEWLAFCDRHHKACAHLGLPVPPGFRVIDCAADTKKLVTWEDMVHPKHYVTLSYVWGGDQGEAENGDGTLPEPQPRTIEDAISLTANLGYRYLWVDRYCIPQADARAKHLQIQSMDVIYQHSALTIIAAAGENPHHGLPGVGETPRKAQPSVTVGTQTLAWVPFIEDEIQQSKWNSRGWTYQEGLLARRRLVFTDTQVYFQCNAMHCLESIHAPLKPLHTQNGARMRDRVNLSRVFPHRTVGKEPSVLSSRINEYLRRSLSYEGDILDAFRGVLAAYERQFSSSRRTLAALPVPVGAALTALTSCLSWRWWCSGRDTPALRRMERRAGFPSWTWLGWKVPRPISFWSGGCRTTALVDASVEYANGLLLPWTANQDLIFKRDRAGCLPLFFHLSGPTLNVHVSATGHGRVVDGSGMPMMDGIDFDYSAPYWAGIAAYTQRGYLGSDFADVHVPFTLLLLGTNGQGDFASAEFLVLYKPQASLHFERVAVMQYSQILFRRTFVVSFLEAARLWDKMTIRIG